MSGHITWPGNRPGWEFDWSVSDHADYEGTVISNAFFKGRKVFYKASLPMIRVQYDSGNGPYKDALCRANLYDMTIVDGRFDDGHRFLCLMAYHKIGRYHLSNRWIFRDDGAIYPQLYSAGLQHPSNHRHHAYWRFDFDIDGAANDLALWNTPSWPQDWGWGPGWYPIKNEDHFSKSGPDRVWAVLNKPTGAGYLIYPGPFDGKDDRFSRGDVWVLRYHGNEDLRGRLGSAGSDDLRKHADHEPTDGADIVFWYVAHLSHEAGDHGDEWHVCGPILTPFGWT